MEFWTWTFFYLSDLHPEIQPIFLICLIQAGLLTGLCIAMLEWNCISKLGSWRIAKALRSRFKFCLWTISGWLGYSLLVGWNYHSSPPAMVLFIFLCTFYLFIQSRRLGDDHILFCLSRLIGWDSGRSARGFRTGSFLLLQFSESSCAVTAVDSIRSRHLFISQGHSIGVPLHLLLQSYAESATGDGADGRSDPASRGVSAASLWIRDNAG